MDEANLTETQAVDPASTEPVTVAIEGTDPTVPDESVPETTTETVPETAAPVVDSEELNGTQATIYNDLSEIGSQETVETTEEVVIVDIIESVGSDISHATLFSGFLVCGTLIGLALLRKIHGT